VQRTSSPIANHAGDELPALHGSTLTHSIALRPDLDRIWIALQQKMVNLRRFSPEKAA
jgi:hypothetical protein